MLIENFIICQILYKAIFFIVYNKNGKRENNS